MVVKVGEELKQLDDYSSDGLPEGDLDVLRELEEFVQPRRNNKNQSPDDVYDMCDQMLEELSYLDT